MNNILKNSTNGKIEEDFTEHGEIAEIGKNFEPYIYNI